VFGGGTTSTRKFAPVNVKVPPVVLLTWEKVMFAVPFACDVTVTLGLSPQPGPLNVTDAGLTVATLVLSETTETTSCVPELRLQPFFVSPPPVVAVTAKVVAPVFSPSIRVITLDVPTIGTVLVISSANTANGTPIASISTKALLTSARHFLPGRIDFTEFPP
jgi:hypothetical protein